MNRRDALKYTSVAFGYAVTASSLTAMLQSCQADVETDGWSPKTLSKGQVDFVADLAETMLPRTDTPGAKDVHVHRFIDELFTQYYSAENRPKELAKLERIQAYVNEAGSKAFVKLSPEEQLSVLSSLNKAAIQAGDNANGVEKEFLAMKGLIISTFFSSEKIGTEVLAYNPVPGPYKGCIPLSDVGKAWYL